MVLVDSVVSANGACVEAEPADPGLSVVVVRTVCLSVVTVLDTAGSDVMLDTAFSVDEEGNGAASVELVVYSTGSDVIWIVVFIVVV